MQRVETITGVIYTKHHLFLLPHRIYSIWTVSGFN